MKKRQVLLVSALLIVSSVFFMVGLGHAQAVRSGSGASVAKNEVINSALYSTGNLNMAGTVNGDVYCAGTNVYIHGTVHGDVLCAAQTIRIDGTVDGSVRLLGRTVTVNAHVGRNASIVAQQVTLNKTARVSGDTSLTAIQAELDGTTGRDALINAHQTVVNGSVGRDLDGHMTSLELGAMSRVQDQLDYTSQQAAQRDKGSAVLGNIRQRQPQSQSNARVLFNRVSLTYLFLSLLLFSLVLVTLLPRLFTQTADRMTRKLGITALAGFGLLVGTPFLLVLLSLTIVGIPLAIITLLAWILIVALSGPVTAYSLGKFVLKRLKYQSAFLFMLVGASILLLLYVIPIIGGISLLTAWILGSGVMVRLLFSHQQSTPAHELKKN